MSKTIGSISVTRKDAGIDIAYIVNGSEISSFHLTFRQTAELAQLLTTALKEAARARH